MAEGKKTRGRQKVQMKKIEDDDDKLVTFSKRKSGMYKKASELVALCHSELGLVIFSPSGKPFTFANPSINSIAHRFTGRNGSQVDSSLPAMYNERQKLGNEEYNRLKVLVENEKSREKELKRITGVKKGQGWWENRLEDLTPKEIHDGINAYKELQRSLDRVIAYRDNVGASSSASPNPSTK